DEDVCVAVAVDVSGGRQGASEAGAPHVALARPCRGQGGAAGRSEVQEGAPLVGLAVVVEGSADQEVGVAVAVHVPRRCHGGAEPGPRLIALGGPCRGLSETAAGSEVDEGPPLVE